MDVAVILMSLILPSLIPIGFKCLHEHLGSTVVLGSFVTIGAVVKPDAEMIKVSVTVNKRY